ncbi:protein DETOXIFICATION 35 isoform X2 [Medicago truncatula]|uniref:Protein DETOXIFICATION n=1 Tax=Medicago truncatula TaxID=3880 RepID=A0A072U963_MEDTR|nr:protein DETOXIFICATION 35 isoform X2 [Medicago truncatula]KEH26207.1 MATE efflux family protein [Medicago truncatula]
METPLLIKSFTSENDYLPLKNLKDVKYVLWNETLKIWKIAIPVALSLLFQNLIGSSNFIYAGHIGDIQLSSYSVYQSVIITIYFSILYGMSNALATLCGQAYGAGKFQNAGIYLQRSWIVLFTTCILLLPILLYATPILKLLGQEKEIADLAGKYAILLIPYMFSFAVNLPLVKFLQAQSKVNVIMYIAMVTLLIQNGLLYIFITVFDWGVIGLAMASNISGWIFSIALVIYAIGWCKEGWNGLSWMAFRELWEFTKLSLGSSVMICLEQWYTACIILLAGHLDNPVIAVGSFSICVRVSNTLGMSHPRAAKYSFLVAISQSLLLGIIFMTVIFLCKEKFAFIFTNSDDIIHAASELAYLLGMTMVINSISQTISGVVIGCGWQVMVGYINLACYYIVGLPIGIFLGFNQHLGVKGLWGGTMCGNILQILVLIVIIYKTNWTKEVEQTANRMRIWSSNNLQNDVI